MEVGKLTVSVRNDHGTSASKKLRAKGLVPGVCYGASVDGKLAPMAISVNFKELKGSLDAVRRTNTVLELTIVDGAKSHTVSALVKDFQVDAIRRNLTHVDFLAIDPNKEVVAEVPLEFTGKHKGTMEGGQLRTLIRSLEVRAKPANIPHKLTVDVTPLGIGDVVHVSDIALPAGVLAVTGRDLAVILCAAPEEDKAAAGDAAVDPAAAAAPAAGKAAAGKAAPAAAAGKAAPAAAGKAAPAAKPAAKK
ncbi:MAG: 50S ribosomal protein L25 [Kofleriaceae bacterium]|nr:50S ribosomal protein L25 [Kofleriaceae bacterium]